MCRSTNFLWIYNYYVLYMTNLDFNISSIFGNLADEQNLQNEIKIKHIRQTQHQDEENVKLSSIKMK